MSVNIYWVPSPDTDVVSYVVLRADAAAGPFTELATIAHDLNGPNYDATSGQFFYVDPAGTAATWYSTYSVDSADQKSPWSAPFQAEEPNTLASLTALKSYLSVKHSNDDALLSRIISAASTWFESQVGRRIVVANYSEQFMGNGGWLFVPAAFPVRTVASVTVDGVAIPAAVAATDNGFRLVGHTIYLRGYRFTYGALVEVSYTAGFDSVPPDIEQAVIELAAITYKRGPVIGVVTKSNSEGSVSFVPTSTPANVQAVIDAYRRVSV